MKQHLTGEGYGMFGKSTMRRGGTGHMYRVYIDGQINTRAGERVGMIFEQELIEKVTKMGGKGVDNFVKWYLKQP